MLDPLTFERCEQIAEESNTKQIARFFHSQYLEIVSLKDRLKAYEEGIPIEEHHKDGSVHWVGDIGDPWGPYFWSDEPNHWGETGWFDECYRGEHSAHRTALPVRVFYPLPAIEKEGE